MKQSVSCILKGSNTSLKYKIKFDANINFIETDKEIRCIGLYLQCNETVIFLKSRVIVCSSGAIYLMSSRIP